MQQELDLSYYFQNINSFPSFYVSAISYETKKKPPIRSDPFTWLEMFLKVKLNIFNTSSFDWIWTTSLTIVILSHTFRKEERLRRSQNASTCKLWQIRIHFLVSNPLIQFRHVWFCDLCVLTWKLHLFKLKVFWQHAIFFIELNIRQSNKISKFRTWLKRDSPCA